MDKMINKIFVLVLVLSISVFTQKRDPEEILAKVKTEFEKVEDYQVDVQTKVDVSFLKMPDRKATIYYKKPDKFHIDSENFAMLPKSGLNFSPLGFLNYKYTAFYEREDTVKGIPASVIKVIPLEGSAEVILSTLWIDTERNIIVKVKSSRKPQGNFIVNLQYLKTSDGFWLPSSILFEFSIDGSGFPKRFGDDEESKAKEKKDDSKKVETGKVYLTYTNYKVNVGLPDSMFDQKTDKK